MPPPADKVIAPAGETVGAPTLYVLSAPVVANFACVAPTYKRTSVAPSARVSVTVPSEVARKEWLPLVRNTLIASSPAETYEITISSSSTRVRLDASSSTSKR